MFHLHPLTRRGIVILHHFFAQVEIPDRATEATHTAFNSMLRTYASTRNRVAQQKQVSHPVPEPVTAPSHPRLLCRSGPVLYRQCRSPMEGLKWGLPPTYVQVPITDSDSDFFPSEDGEGRNIIDVCYSKPGSQSHLATVTY